MDESLTLAIERRAVRAVPAAETVDLDGWLLSLGRGAVGRINSVTAFGVRPFEPLETVEKAERRYRARRRPVKFRLTELDADLDRLLWARGYERTDDVLVMTAQVPDTVPIEVEVTSGVTDHWLTLLHRFGGYDPVRVDELGESLRRLDLAHGVFVLDEAAVGVAVLDDGWVGVFDVAVDPRRRRRGLGSRLVEGMLAWAADRGAEGSYIQVHHENHAAIDLYRSVGFTESYRYWYRSRD